MKRILYIVRPCLSTAYIKLAKIYDYNKENEIVVGTYTSLKEVKSKIELDYKQYNDKSIKRIVRVFGYSEMPFTSRDLKMEEIREDENL